ncbi:MAG TPA: hypothetical protein VGK87_10635 [Anaerolineae bacterium]
MGLPVEPSFINDWISKLLCSLPSLRSHYGVQRLWLYGPHIRGKAAPGVPLDILADVAGPLSYDDFHALQAHLSELLALPVELVLMGSMDPSIAEIVIPEMIEIVKKRDQ